MGEKHDSDMNIHFRSLLLSIIFVLTMLQFQSAASARESFCHRHEAAYERPGHTGDVPALAAVAGEILGDAD